MAVLFRFGQTLDVLSERTNGPVVIRIGAGTHVINQEKCATGSLDNPVNLTPRHPNLFFHSIIYSYDNAIRIAAKWFFSGLECFVHDSYYHE